MDSSPTNASPSYLQAEGPNANAGSDGSFLEAPGAIYTPNAVAVHHVPYVMPADLHLDIRPPSLLSFQGFTPHPLPESHDSRPQWHVGVRTLTQLQIDLQLSTHSVSISPGSSSMGYFPISVQTPVSGSSAPMQEIDNYPVRKPLGSTWHWRQVPQRLWVGRNTVESPNARAFYFMMIDGAYMLVTDALKGRYTGLVERDITPFSTSSGRNTSIRIEWPGYNSFTRQIKTMNWKNDPESSKLEKIVTEVAKVLKIFFDEVSDTLIDPLEERWRIGPVGSPYITIEKVQLLGMIPRSKGSWQPVILAAAHR